MQISASIPPGEPAESFYWAPHYFFKWRPDYYLEFCILNTQGCQSVPLKKPETDDGEKPEKARKAKQNKLFVSGNPPVPKKRCRVSKFYSFLVENKIFIDIPCLLFDRKFSETVFILF